MIHIIHKNDELFPESLRTIREDCPDTIFALGNVDLLKSEHMAAIIGSRAASQKGNDAAFNLAARFAHQGYVIVSGLALGCDSSAHRGCLSVGGKTIAVVATGVDRVHPKQNVGLQAQILNSGGLIISEQPLGVKANPTRLIARNRIQAALSETVVVAECPIHSGTMHTVEFAKKYGKTIRTVKYAESSESNSGNTYIMESGIGDYIPALDSEDGSAIYTFTGNQQVRKL